MSSCFVVPLRNLAKPMSMAFTGNASHINITLSCVDTGDELFRSHKQRNRCVLYWCSEEYQREAGRGQEIRHRNNWALTMCPVMLWWIHRLNVFLWWCFSPRKIRTREGEVSGRLLHLLHANLLLRQTREMFPSVCRLIMADYRTGEGSQVILL